MRACFFVDHRRVNVFVRVLNFRSWSQQKNYFNSAIFPIYSISVLNESYLVQVRAYSARRTKQLVLE